ncbi:hypothetical protein TUMEXPCC7403_08030 [Tumidithrix helvetica PCC 7403]
MTTSSKNRIQYFRMVLPLLLTTITGIVYQVLNLTGERCDYQQR